MAAAFLIIDDPVTGRTALTLHSGERFSVGRAPVNRIVVHDERASRLHAEIAEASSGWTVRDLDSRNGTLLRGQPITAVQSLAAGDVISIGSVKLTFTDRDPTLDDETDGTASGTGVASGDLQAWRASITHRRTRSRLLENLHEAAAAVPRVGRAAADLCRLAFALGRIDDVAAAAKLALETALRGVQAGRGIVLLPPRVADLNAVAAEGHGTDALGVVASVPTPWPAGATPAGVVAAVLSSDEAVLAAGGPTTSSDPATSTISAPIRVRGRAVGVMHVEVQDPAQQASADDLEFTLAVCDALGLAAENLVAKEELSTRLASTADENERLRQRLGEEARMVVASPVLQGIVGQVQRVASTKATVLVRGESGVGKELVARSIHDSSDRRGGPFVCLNCAALSETLLESELFGHEKGSFTGATERKIGKFEQAHRGTLMLDEIGEMSPAIQAKFLRVLEGHPFERVGGSARVQVDVRVVAATNRNLEDAVASGGFRRDLYFRLKVVEILIPPLRRRPEDVEALARHFLERFAAETGRRVRGFTPQALESMQTYPWPGNIRELRNCIERAVVLSQDEWIDAADVVLTQLAVPGDTGCGQAVPSGPFVPQTIDEVEHRHVIATLEAVGGNKTKAASILGIERSTLDRKLAKWAAK